jgi:hypothetical protein
MQLFIDSLTDALGNHHDLLTDRLAHVFRHQVFFIEVLPRADCAVRHVRHHRPQGTRGQTRGIREAAHLIGRDFTETTAAAETQRGGIVRYVRKRGDKIRGRREDDRGLVKDISCVKMERSASCDAAYNPRPADHKIGDIFISRLFSPYRKPFDLA